MAPEDIKGKKRKGASEAAPKAKKAKKSDDVAAAPTAKPVKAPKSAAATTAPKATKGKAARKEAADFFSDDEAPTAEVVKDAAKATKSKKKGKAVAETNGETAGTAVAEAPVAQDKPKKAGKKAKIVVTEEIAVTEAPKEKTKSSKKGKEAEAAPVVAEVTTVVEAEEPVKKSKKAKGSKKQEKPVEEPVEEVAEVEATDAADGDVEEDDQTAALLAGFESDDSDKDPEDDEDFDEDAPVPKLSKKQRTALEKATQGPKSNEPGVVYVGRVPRGFFEPQMKKYFSQFGRVKRLRLSRNKKTGASKHYAFVEFQSSEVADIVARTMDNYLLFGHILKCKFVPADQVHPDLFKGAGERFKVDPRNKKAGLEMERGVPRAQWEKRVEKEKKRRTERNKALKEMFGYEYIGPELKSVDTVPIQIDSADAPDQLEDAPVEEPAAPAIAPPKIKKNKKAAAPKEIPALEVEADLQAEIAAQVGAPTPEKKTKAKKDKKRKSDDALETLGGAEETEVLEANMPKKAKKVKKAKA